MKKIIKRVATVAVCILLLVSCLAGCSQKGKTLMELDGETLSLNTYMLFLSRIKGTLSSTANFGSSASKDSFWDIVMNSDGTTTYNDYYCNMVLDSAKAYLAAMYIFEEEGLKLPKEYKDAINEEMDRLVETDGKGSKAALNSILAAYGANYEILKNAYELEAKMYYLNEHLYGKNGEKIASNVIEEYYQESYVKFRHVFLYTYDVVYETDANGDEIYYTSSGAIAYDTSKRQKTDTDGNPVKDSSGNIIYLNRDGSIAYDKENGQRMAKIGSDGNAEIKDYTGAELNAVLDKAQIIMENAVEGNESVFDALVDEYNEDAGMDELPGGYYVTRDTDYPEEIINALFEMEEGEIRKIKTDSGIHVVMKYELDKGGYAKEANATFFADEKGNYLFMDALKERLLTARVQKYLDQIVIKEDLIKNVNMKSVEPNTDY